MKYIQNLFLAIDQLGNALAGGNADLSVSARVGYHMANGGGRYWKALGRVIDFTFYPLDGVGHCDQAYRADQENYGYESGKKFALMALGGLVIVACLFIAPAIRIVDFFSRSA